MRQQKVCIEVKFVVCSLLVSQIESGAGIVYNNYGVDVFGKHDKTFKTETHLNQNEVLA